MSLNECRFVEISNYTDQSGKINIIEENIYTDFNIKRVYYLYDLHKKSNRGNHAYINVKQIIISIKGSCKIILDDGKSRKEFSLISPNIGIYVPHSIWRNLYDFTDGTILLVLADQLYKDSKFIKDYDEFRKLVTLIFDPEDESNIMNSELLDFILIHRNNIFLFNSS